MRVPDGARPVSRVLHGLATVLLAVGFLSVSVALWSLFVTVDDGGGADIGGGILALFGLAVGAFGLLLLVAAGVVAAIRRTRGRPTT